jgi:hypothetical protein
MDSIFTQSSPQIIFRSKLFMLNTATYFSCNTSYTMTYKWSANLIVSSTIVTKIDLYANPTWQSTSLVIQANTLAYGLYAFKFQTNVTIPKTISNIFLTNNIATYVQITPTGLAVYGLENGVLGLLIGSQQSFSLKPALYSLDLDLLIKPSSLQYKFYCFTISQGSNTIVNATQSVDLFSYKNNSLFQMNSNSTCFSSNSNLIFIYLQMINILHNVSHFILSYLISLH